jgi:hypothetical protein
MKKIQQTLSMLLLSTLFLCFSQKATAQQNQYQMKLDVSVLSVSGKLVVKCSNPVSVYNRVDFVLSGSGISSIATINGGNPSTSFTNFFTGSGQKSINFTSS